MLLDSICLEANIFSVVSHEPEQRASLVGLTPKQDTCVVRALGLRVYVGLALSERTSHARTFRSVTHISKNKLGLLVVVSTDIQNVGSSIVTFSSKGWPILLSWGAAGEMARRMTSSLC